MRTSRGIGLTAVLLTLGSFVWLLQSDAEEMTSKVAPLATTADVATDLVLPAPLAEFVQEMQLSALTDAPRSDPQDALVGSASLADFEAQAELLIRVHAPASNEQVGAASLGVLISRPTPLGPLERAARRDEARVAVEAAGSFRLQLSVMENLLLELRHPDHALLRHRVSSDDLARGVLDLQLLRGNTILGRVLAMSADGSRAPLSGARVELLTEPSVWSATPGVSSGAQSGGSSGVSSGVSSGATPSSSSGAPTGSASIRATGLLSTRSDAEGSFRLSGIPSGRARLRAEAAGFAVGESEIFEFGGSGEELVVELRLERPGRVSGRVFDEDGEPVDEAWVALGDARQLDERSLIPWRFLDTRSEADGGFEFEAVPPGLYQARARRLGAEARAARDAGVPAVMLPVAAATAEALAVVEVRAGRDEELLLVLLEANQETPCRVRGQVSGLETSGALAYEVVIHFGLDEEIMTMGESRDRRQRVERDGGFDLGAIPPGSATVGVSAVATSPAEPATTGGRVIAGTLVQRTLQLPPGGDVWVELQLEGHGLVEVHVLDAESGEALSGFGLSWFGPGRRGGGRLLKGEPLELAMLEGRNLLRAEVAGYVYAQREIEVRGVLTTPPVELLVERARPWRPRLVDPNGAPIADMGRLLITTFDGIQLGMNEMILGEIELVEDTPRVIADRLPEGVLEVQLLRPDGKAGPGGTLDLRRTSDTAVFRSR